MLVSVQDILLGLGSFAGGIGLVLSRQWLIGRNGGKLYPERSSKTGGSKQISEEGLGRIARIETELSDKFLEEKDHRLLCRSVQLEFENTMRQTLQDEFKSFKKELMK